ncbi:hypothetical protein L596_012271 [Steinernema carpocapsae]|uniref:Uncharacterized protein n=1 Tax=Steinernema carpocapsae TaxID=34508 RepID=A0A4U5NWS2_STECR|nr:hypothetical protein L596_012271 [Steinernema carpocapsae]
MNPENQRLLPDWLAGGCRQSAVQAGRQSGDVSKIVELSPPPIDETEEEARATGTRKNEPALLNVQKGRNKQLTKSIEKLRRGRGTRREQFQVERTN